MPLLPSSSICLAPILQREPDVVCKNTGDTLFSQTYELTVRAQVSGSFLVRGFLLLDTYPHVYQ